MRQFIGKIAFFILLLVGVLTFSLFCIPDKVSENNILAALTDKHKMLEHGAKEKIILVGGSNVSFGADSKKLSDSLGRPVINMGLHAGLGLKFILNDLISYVREGDLVILMPEYENFYTDNFFGEMELVSVAFDVDPDSKRMIDAGQWMHLLRYLPTYSARKIKNYMASAFQKKTSVVDIYHRNSFNKFGDASLHWGLPDQNYLPAMSRSGTEKIYPEAITCLKDLREQLRNKNARLLIFPPVMDSTSFAHQKLIITKIAQELQNSDLAFEVEPAEYRYSGSLFFNSYYHLNKKGVDKRTEQLIRELRQP